MLKYLNTQVTFAEVPDEITLCINITGCKNGCKNCHSSYLAQDIGKPLNKSSLSELIEGNKECPVCPLWVEIVMLYT